MRTWRLDISYTFDWDRMRDLDRLIEDAVGVRSWASGAGFGFRDLTFDLPGEWQANEAHERVRVALAHVGVHCESRVWWEDDAS